MCSQSLIGWWKPAINFIFYFHILHDFTWRNLLHVRQWLKIDTQFSTQISVSFSQGILVLQPCWQCAARNTILFSNFNLSFHFFINFVKNLELCIKRYWFTFACHCDIWLPIEVPFCYILVIYNQLLLYIIHTHTWGEREREGCCCCCCW